MLLLSIIITISVGIICIAPVPGVKFTVCNPLTGPGCNESFNTHNEAENNALGVLLI